MKLLLLVLTVTLLLAQVTPVMKCWGKSGRCRTTCKQSEVFYILCKTEFKCCVEPKNVRVKPELPNTDGSLRSSSAV
ncbi:PREDICTED: beta-defensin 121-like [Propithecus coquereli]|uniref:Beta-defensin n=1 Tax=Propithecus coquereli TaxID=379532 RepID=A0A2K6ELX2_PROCO|nr:PREDICTED: beta-defensin 121-like [Propithecus coquereli]